jgi:hypothetical protein
MLPLFDKPMTFFASWVEVFVGVKDEVAARED